MISEKLCVTSRKYVWLWEKMHESFEKRYVCILGKYARFLGNMHDLLKIIDGIMHNECNSAYTQIKNNKNKCAQGLHHYQLNINTLKRTQMH